MSGATAASETTTFAFGFFAAQLILFVAGIVQKRLLGPHATGAWTLLETLWSFFALASLGAGVGSGREIPAFRGKGDFDKAALAANTGASFSIASFALVGIVAAVVAILVGDSWSPYLRWGLVLLGVISPLRALINVHTDIFRLTRWFHILAVSLIVNALLILVVQTACVAILGFWGMYVGVAITALATLALWTALGATGVRKPAFHWQIDRSMLRHLSLVGIPVLLYSNLWVLFTSVDSLLVAAFLDVRHVGYYSIAVSVNSYVLFLPRVISGALFPRMQERYSARGQVSDIRHYAVDVPRLLAYLFVPILLIAAFFILPVLVRQVLPRFTPGIGAIRVIVAASFFLSLADMPIEFMITAGNRWRITGVLVGVLVINVGVNIIALGVLHAGLVGAAAASGCAYCVLFVTITLWSVSVAASLREAVRQVIRLAAVGIYVIGTLWGVELLVGNGGGALWQDLSVALMKVVLALVLVLPLIASAERKYRPLVTLAGTAASTLRGFVRRMHSA